MFIHANILAPQLGLFFWTLLIFLTVFFLLRAFAWKPILNALKEREDTIQSQLDAAADAENRMRALQADNEKLLNEARLERDKMLKEAKDTKDRIIGEARSEAAVQAARELADAKRQIAMEKNAALAAIRAEASALAIQAAEAILRAELADKAKQKTFADRVIQDLRLN